MMTTKKKQLVSFVLPAYREEKNVPLMYDALMKEITQLSGYDYEIIFVNDGSPDSTWEVIQSVCKKDTKVKGVNLSRNFGKEIALTTGVQKASGDAVITLDVDMGNILLLKFLSFWKNGKKDMMSYKTSDFNLACFLV